MYADMMDTIAFVKNADPEVGQAMERELQRQRRNLELIASENLVSSAVMAAMGSVLTNKYAEGYPLSLIHIYRRKFHRTCWRHDEGYPANLPGPGPLQ